MRDDLRKLYKKRFGEKERIQKDVLWKILCSHFFQQFISQDAVILDIGAGFCEFINNIQCAKKYAVDLNPEIAKYANPEVEIFNSPSTDLSFLTDNSTDIVFMSNFLEHLRSKDEIIKTLKETQRILKPGGGVMILGPNIRYLYREYWDFFDHHVPLSDKSLVEVLEMLDYKIERILTKFLPYTTKSRIPHISFLVKVYMKMPFMWKILGKQLFILARK